MYLTPVFHVVGNTYLSPGSSFLEDGSECGNSEFYESECCESESGEGWESEPEASDGGSLYIYSHT